jgi:hypothetical protein
MTYAAAGGPGGGKSIPRVLRRLLMFVVMMNRVNLNNEISSKRE